MSLKNIIFFSKSEKEMFRKFEQKSQKLSMIATIRWYFILFAIVPIPEQSLPISLRKFRSFINVIHIGFMVVSLFLYTISLIYFVLFEAKTTAEYSETALFLAAILLQWSFYYVAVSKRFKLIGIMNDLMDISDKSNLKCNI